METASICIALWKDKYYLQVITAQNENHYFVPISQSTVKLFQKLDNIQVYNDIVVMEYAITK